jgi:hypothetical protein
MVGLGPGDRVPLAVAGDSHRVDREHWTASRSQRGDQQTAGSFDRHWDWLLAGVAEFGEQVGQFGEAGDILVDPLLRHQLAVDVDHGQVVMAFGPVDPAEQCQPTTSGRSVSLLVKSQRERAAP